MSAANSRSTDYDGTITRSYLAELFAVGGFVVILAIGGISLWRKPDDTSILNALLPLVASWVGTVIAYYFSRENLAAATTSVATMAKGMSDLQRLEAVGVSEKMIPRAGIVALPAEMAKSAGGLDAVSLKDIVEFAARAPKPITRLPVLQDGDMVTYLIHLSTVNQFIAKQALAGNGNGAALTFKNFIADPQVRAIASGSFATVAPSATLADAKKRMDETPQCEDVFVTVDGTKGSAVVGWVTDDAIWTVARV